MSTPISRISDGPSMLDMLFALAKCYDKNPFRVQMMVYEEGSSIGIQHDIAINNLGHEDGSGHKWLFAGYIVDSSLPRWQKVEGFYDSATRKGTLKKI